MSKEIEIRELVEEIAYFLSKHRFVSHDVRVVEADRDYAREIIRSILSAVRDGRVKIPGEYWRGRGDLLLNMTVDFDLSATGQIIALRVLAGTSKQEKQ